MALEKPKKTGPDSMNRAIAHAMKSVDFPDLKALLCQIMRRMRGPKGVAKLIWEEYDAAKPGSMVRSMILQMVLQGAKAISHKESARDVSLISDDDLEAEMTRLMSKLIKSPPEKEENGPQTSEPA